MQLKRDSTNYHGIFFNKMFLLYNVGRARRLKSNYKESKEIWKQQKIAHDSPIFTVLMQIALIVASLNSSQK